MLPNHCDARVRALCGDALELTTEGLRAHQPLGFTTVLSDMCPATTGSGSLDATRSAVLAEAAVELALGEHGVPFNDSSETGEARPHLPSNLGVLLPGGALVVKLLEGDGGAKQTLQAICKVRICICTAVTHGLTCAARAAELCKDVLDAAEGDARHLTRGVSGGTRQTTCECMTILLIFIRASPWRAFRSELCLFRPISLCCSLRHRSFLELCLAHCGCGTRGITCGDSIRVGSSPHQSAGSVGGSMCNHRSSAVAENNRQSAVSQTHCSSPHGK